MVERGSGSIVNISSGAAVMGMPIHAPYGAAKAGLESLTMSFAAALAPHGVRVNCVRVGAIKSEGFLRAMASAGIDPDEMGARAAGPRTRGHTRRDRLADPVPRLRGVELHLGPDALRGWRAQGSEPLTRRRAQPRSWRNGYLARVAATRAGSTSASSTVSTAPSASASTSPNGPITALSPA